MQSKPETTDNTLLKLLSRDFAFHIQEAEYDENIEPTKENIDIVKKNNSFNDDEAKLIFNYFLREQLLRDLFAKIIKVENKMADLGIEHETYKRILDDNTIELKMHYKFKTGSNPFALFQDTSMRQDENPKYVAIHKNENEIEVTAHLDYTKQSRL